MAKKDIWDRLEVKTGRQVTLWVLTIAVAIVFGNNLFDFIINTVGNPGISVFVYFGLIFIFRIILGHLFD